MSDVVVIGGEGFLGSAIVEALDADSLGRSQDADIQANILLHEDLGALQDYDVVINCVGLSPLFEPKTPYKAIHVNAVKNILHVLDDDQHYVHISAVGADPEVKPTYLRTKGVAEAIIRDNHEYHSILRPDIMYDASSETWRERMVKPFRFGVMPYLSKRSRPVHRGDVADAVHHVVDEDITGSYDVYGDESMTMTDIVRRIGGQRVLTIPEFVWYPFFFAACEARLFNLSRDQRILYDYEFDYGDRPDWFTPSVIPE